MCEEHNRFVRLQVDVGQTPEQKGAHYSHPLLLDSVAWARLLQGIRVQSRSEGFLFGSTTGPIVEAFTAEDIQFFSIALSKAFAEARPEEAVVFGIARSRTPELTEITTGSWFVTENSLHLVLANYRTAVTLPGIRALLWEEPLRRQPGLRYELVPGEYQTLVHTKGEGPILFSSSQPSQVVIQYRSIVRPEPPTVSSSPRPTLQPGPVEERLERLKRLWEQGLVTEEEYAAKKKELLDRL
ncbi:SHOCT domain-containing protein [Nitrospira sp. NS4]|uniref:SHOCT domain-containing protein n=1 Tax=Nitrospira sp. NS4 TaxID=3414498 RepID=UPI003C2F0666